MTLREYCEELERLAAAAAEAAFPKPTMAMLEMAITTARRDLHRLECPHPPERTKRQLAADGSTFVTCLKCGRQTVEPPAHPAKS